MQTSRGCGYGAEANVVFSLPKPQMYQTEYPTDKPKIQLKHLQKNQRLSCPLVCIVRMNRCARI